MSQKRTTGPATLIAIVSVTALVSGGCTASQADKSGGSKPPTVLVMANNNGDSLAGAPAVAHFVDRVAALSGGQLTVRVESSWKGGADEARVIRDVAAGEADLGWSGTRAFDVVGDDAFEPVHAPFLISSYPAEAAVVKDPLAQDLLDSLHPLGLTGLALVADELRMPAAAAKPLLNPSDFKGLRFYTSDSTIQADAIRALGAVPTTGVVPRSPDANGRLDAVETMWWTYEANNQAGLARFVTANAALWPRTVAIFANTKLLAALDTRSRAWVTQAAQEATAWSTTHAADGVTDTIQRACTSGAHLAEASSQQLAALRAATEPVYAALRAKPDLATTLSRIEKLVAADGPSMPTGVPASCVYHRGDETRIPPPIRTLTGPGRPGDLPQATYRFSLTEGELLAHGEDAHDAHMNAGVVTWTLSKGGWQSVQKPVDPSVEHTTCEGWYDVHGADAIFTTTTTYAGGTCAAPTWSARWSLANHQLTWSAISDPDFAYVWGSKPWQQIG
jgi:TRAP-type C4-dicarboxylate transport system substrate-binding protein